MHIVASLQCSPSAFDAANRWCTLHFKEPKLPDELESAMVDMQTLENYKVPCHMTFGFEAAKREKRHRIAPAPHTQRARHICDTSTIIIGSIRVGRTNAFVEHLQAYFCTFVDRRSGEFLFVCKIEP